MIRKKLRKWLPTPDHLRSQVWLRWCAPVLGHPRLWHLHRKSVSLGVAIGFLTGLIPGPVQMLSAALLAIALRANVPAAVFTTLYTNPVTFIPMYILAYKIGSALTGEQAPFVAPPEMDFSWSGFRAMMPAIWDWIVALGEPLVVGVIAVSATLAVFGYVATRLVWRVVVTVTWRRRAARRATR